MRYFLMFYLCVVVQLGEVSGQRFDLTSSPPCTLLKVDSIDIDFLSGSYDKIINSYKSGCKEGVCVFEVGVYSGRRGTFMNVARLSTRTGLLTRHEYKDGRLTGEQVVEVNGYVLQSILKLWNNFEFFDFEIFPVSLGRGQDDSAYIIASGDKECRIYTRGLKLSNVPYIMTGEAIAAFALINSLSSSGGNGSD